ncbi:MULTISPECIES: hypothetical protein [Methylobacterium]|uniref:hypothetical protein n=1 Tax=Methylobacterium TaxID=407 RepID=UPI0013EA1DBF|nr:hypothetical protein [Methylobacterium sp. DB0501]NGM38245.1 hypothetical protein [Methylobacterium sp. DB0501]
MKGPPIHDVCSAGALMCADDPAALLRRRALPCLCPRQHDALDAHGRPIPGSGQTARTVGASLTRGRLRERVACTACPRTWTRVNG